MTQRRNVHAFTMVELLVVIGIIVILISILIPVAGRVRMAAQNASTQALISNLSTALESYNSDFRAYPGPLSNLEVNNDSFNTISAFGSNHEIAPDANAEKYQTTDANFPKNITMAENVVLGLFGGLRYNQPTLKWQYDPRIVGNGAVSLNNTGPSKRSKVYFDAKNLSWREEGGFKTGHFRDELGEADDTIIPEIVDSYPDGLPLLIMRAKKGAAVNPALPYDEKNNTIITYDTNTGAPRMGQYDLHQIIGYTSSPIGTGRKPPKAVGWPTAPTHGLSNVSVEAMGVKQDSAAYRYPYDAYPYIRNQQLSSPAEASSDYPSPTSTNPRVDVPHQKDGIIIISAGPDRVYGTRDDITNFGPVGQ